MVTLGNFFSGSGTWELAAELCGATPIWESEIEPFPIELEHKRFPNCKQLGDITKVSGYDIEPCDIMTNSSPCQDISVAGLRRSMAKGSDTRSSLFHEVIRITKEMREHELEQLRRMSGANDNIRLYPRPYLWCWENVTGALSSNKGEDFRQVLEEIAKIVQADVSIPLPRGGGGQTPDSWTETDIQSLGVSETQLTRECHRDAEESFLWQILEEDVPQKYFLSERACVGILRRSEKRGKPLPQVLKNALMKQGGISEQELATLNVTEGK